MTNQLDNYVRGLNKRFIDDLNFGVLKEFLELCKGTDYSLEIRKNYLNIYYKGGNAIKITQQTRDYRFDFDTKYCNDINKIKSANYNNTLKNLDNHKPIDFYSNRGLISKDMENWFSIHPKLEREFQHSLTKNKHTNFKIIDIEYAGVYSNISNAKKEFRLDMLASCNDNNVNKLIIVENKFGDKIDAKSGVGKHLADIQGILSDPFAKNQLILSTNSILRNKYDLGLIDNLIQFNIDAEIEILFILANYKGTIADLRNAISSIPMLFPRFGIITKYSINVPLCIDYNSRLKV